MKFGLWFQKNKSNWYILLAVLMSLATYFSVIQVKLPVLISLKASILALPTLIIWGLIAILLCSRRSWPQSLIMAVILLVVAYADTQSTYSGLTILFLFAFANWEIDLNKLIKYDLIVRMAVILFASLLTAAHLATDTVIYRYDSLGGVSLVRHSLGFFHPNTLMALVLLMILEWLYLRYGQLRWWEVAVLIGVTLSYNGITNSKTSTILALAGILGSYGLQLLRHWPSINKSVRNGLGNLLKVWVPVLAVLDIAMMYLPKHSGLFKHLNGLLSSRVEIGRFYLRQSGIHLFNGNVGKMFVSKEGYSFGIDSSYVQQLVFWGILVVIAFVWIMQRSITYMVKTGSLDIAFLFALVALLAVTEAMTNNVGENIAIFGLFAYVGHDRLSSLEYNTVNQFNFTRQYGLM